MKRYILLFLFLFNLSKGSEAFVFNNDSDETINFFDETLEKYKVSTKLVIPTQNGTADKALIANLIGLKKFEADGVKVRLTRKFIKADVIDDKMHIFYSLPQLNIIMKYVCEFKDFDGKCGFLAQISCFHNIEDACEFYISGIGHISFQRENDQEAYISYIGIDEVFKGYGLGTIIFEQALKFIENENKCDQIRLIVLNGPKNLAAVKLYENQGFKWVQSDTNEMIKKIKPKSKL